MPRLARIGAPLAVAALLAALPVAAPGQDSGRGPTARAAATCHLSYREQQHLGTTYVIKLTVRVTKCSDAKRIVRAYHACRHRHGGRDGHCRGVFGYRCTERRYDKSRFSYDANAVCTKSNRRVWHHYQQNL